MVAEGISQQRFIDGPRRMGPGVRRDDGWCLQAQLRDLAACFARGLACSFRPRKSEGAGNAGRPMHPQPRVRYGSKYAHEYSQRVTGIIRHSPRNGLRLIPALSPVIGFLATVVMR